MKGNLHTDILGSFSFEIHNNVCFILVKLKSFLSKLDFVIRSRFLTLLPNQNLSWAQCEISKNRRDWHILESNSHRIVWHSLNRTCISHKILKVVNNPNWPYLLMYITATDKRRPPKNTPKATPIETTMSMPYGKSVSPVNTSVVPFCVPAVCGSKSGVMCECKGWFLIHKFDNNSRNFNLPLSRFALDDKWEWICKAVIERIKVRFS